MSNDPVKFPTALRILHERIIERADNRDELRSAVKLLEGVQDLIEDLAMSKHDGYGNVLDDAPPNDPDVKWAEGYEKATEHALDKLRALALGTKPV
jgi:hypothetical protein